MEKKLIKIINGTYFWNGEKLNNEDIVYVQNCYFISFDNVSIGNKYRYLVDENKFIEDPYGNFQVFKFTYHKNFDKKWYQFWKPSEFVDGVGMMFFQKN